MADQFELSAVPRKHRGRSPSRRLRRKADQVPVILYGAGQDPQPLSIPHKELHKACENEAFFSHIITLNAGGKSQEVILKDLQRHPAKDRIMHADFMRIRRDQTINVEVPLHFINEDSCVGVRQSGGNISHNMTAVEVSCLPGDLPEFIEFDVQELDVGDVIHMSELTLPAGLTMPALQQGPDHDHVVVSVHAPRREEEEEETIVDEEGAEEPSVDADETAAPGDE